MVLGKMQASAGTDRENWPHYIITVRADARWLTEFGRETGVRVVAADSLRARPPEQSRAQYLLGSMDTGSH